MSVTDLRRRRRALLKAIGPDGIAILPGAREVIRNRDVHYPFRQASDFTYLTGFPEPDAVAVFAPGRKEGEFVLFCRPRDPEREQWDGYRAGVEGAVATYQADQAHPLSELDSRMPGLLDGRTPVLFPIGADPAFDARVFGWVKQVRANVRTGAVAPETFVTLEAVLHEQRLKKSAAEVKLMRQAARLSAAGHCRLMQRCRPGLGEADLETEFIHHCAARGARVQAYPPIVAGGAHACVLHYVENDAPLKDGDLVLVDAGCEWHGYASDITRTFPVNGRFSAPQRELYQLVLAAQRAAIAKARPGNRWNEPHEAALKVLTKGLIRLGILEGKSAQLIKDEAYKAYYMHRTGHWLGMDVHDVGHYKRHGEWRLLTPGMVLTVEPGLYMPATDAVPEAYRLIGIRIEDDVLITAGGNEVLSAAVPTDPDAIEALMGSR
ncbi:aminopeptidase P N-terminal domain-containing protein [uncultured Thiodictyon sp.]|uniref:aminopeptidase P N-terminal domain-containing protein n=1 Tax=uncultured Thiodictyon sp. TaxID=1846217 RepID=UPI0025D49F48|nr:aminopeptidase P N-terminal domain-containing protein [uncultured Thiodictyon sp.]